MTRVNLSTRSKSSIDRPSAVNGMDGMGWCVGLKYHMEIGMAKYVQRDAEGRQGWGDERRRIDCSIV
jgi:hypothetical protein